MEPKAEVVEARIRAEEQGAKKKKNDVFLTEQESKAATAEGRKRGAVLFEEAEYYGVLMWDSEGLDGDVAMFEFAESR